MLVSKESLIIRHNIPFMLKANSKIIFHLKKRSQIGHLALFQSVISFPVCRKNLFKVLADWYRQRIGFFCHHNLNSKRQHKTQL